LQERHDLGAEFLKVLAASETLAREAVE